MKSKKPKRCRYCESFSHPSDKCDIYETNEFRQQILLVKECCDYSFHPDKHPFWCYNNTSKRKCYICFTRQLHHTVQCPYKSTVPKWFLPKIDKVLLSRFLQFFSPIDLFNFVRQCSEALNYANLINFNVVESYPARKNFPSPDTVIIVVKNISVDLKNEELEKLAKTVETKVDKNVIIKLNVQLPGDENDKVVAFVLLVKKIKNYFVELKSCIEGYPCLMISGGSEPIILEGYFALKKFKYMLNPNDLLNPSDLLNPDDLLQHYLVLQDIFLMDKLL